MLSSTALNERKFFKGISEIIIPIKLAIRNALNAPAILKPRVININAKSNFNAPPMTDSDTSHLNNSSPCNAPVKTGVIQEEASNKAKI